LLNWKKITHDFAYFVKMQKNKFNEGIMKRVFAKKEVEGEGASYRGSFIIS